MVIIKMNKPTVFLIFFFFNLSMCNATANQLVKTDKLHVDMTWQWQLSGKLNMDYPVDLYDLDLFDTPHDVIQKLQSDGKVVICYFSAGSYENWREDKSQFDQTSLAKAMDGWEGERWLDIRKNNVKDIMKKRLDLAKKKGCDGVEPDNVDAYDNQTGLDLSKQDQRKYNLFLATEAHQRGLLIGLKNSLDQVGELVDNFDFSVNEQCHEYNECENLNAFIQQGKPVFNAEYKKQYVKNTKVRGVLCGKAKGLKIKTLVLPLELDDSFRLSCD